MTIERMSLLFVVFVLSVSTLSYNLGSNGAFSGSGGSVQSAGWLSGWSYRKAHNITGSIAGEQFNYQMMLNVRYDNGMDMDGEVYLDGKCRSDFGDIRFTDTAGENLSYWIRQKVDAVQALFCVKMSYIPQSLGYTTVYVYYGNPNATTTSNKDWTFPLCSDFEDGTMQGWTISWSTCIVGNGVSTSAYERTYSREAGRLYGTWNGAGAGHFYERFRTSLYLASGTYHVEGAGRFDTLHSWEVPKEIKLMVGEITVSNVSNPGTEWHWLSGNFTLNVGGYVELGAEFHLLFIDGYGDFVESYFIDAILVRKWCNPEPQHGTWSREQTSADNTPPEIASVVWTPTCPYPFVPSSVPRQREPVLVQANATDYESGIAAVYLSFRAIGSQWWNTSMIYNLTLRLWTAVIPGQTANTTVEFFVTAYDLTGNVRTGTIHDYSVKYLILGDVNGDGICDLKDVFMVHKNYGKTSP